MDRLLSAMGNSDRLLLFLCSLPARGVVVCHCESLSFCNRAPCFVRSVFWAQDSLTQEFSSCVQRVIEMVNDGELTMRTRGAKKDSVTATMADLRKKTVALTQQQGVTIKQKFKAVALRKWETKHPGKDPESLGYQTKMLRLPGDTFLTKCVLFRATPADEFDVEVNASLQSSCTETLLESSMALRAGQETQTFNAAANAVLSTVPTSGECRPIEDWTCPKSVAQQKTACDATQLLEDSDGELSKDESEECVSLLQQTHDPFAGSLLEGLMTPGKGSSSSKGGSPQADKSSSRPTNVVAPAASRKGSRQSRSRSRTRSARQPSSLASKHKGGQLGVAAGGSSQEVATPKSRGKGSKIPADTASLLDYEGFGEYQSKTAEILGKLKHGILDTVPASGKDTAQSAQHCFHAQVSTSISGKAQCGKTQILMQ